MTTIDSTIYILDSKLKSSGTNNNANYNMINSGTIGPGTYSMASYHSINQFYNCETGVNDLIVWDEAGQANLSVVLPAGYYSSSTLATAIDLAMTTESAASGDTNTYVTTYNSITGKYSTTDGAGSDWGFDWLSQVASTNLARKLMGYSSVDTLPVAKTHVSDLIVDLTLHQQLLIDITQDNNQNVTALTGTEYSLIVPLNGDYQEDIDSMRQDTFSQNIKLSSSLNSLDVLLFTEDGTALVNSPDYVLTLQKLF